MQIKDSPGDSANFPQTQIRKENLSADILGYKMGCCFSVLPGSAQFCSVLVLFHSVLVFCFVLFLFSPVLLCSVLLPYSVSSSVLLCSDPFPCSARHCLVLHFVVLFMFRFLCSALLRSIRVLPRFVLLCSITVHVFPVPICSVFLLWWVLFSSAQPCVLPGSVPISGFCSFLFRSCSCSVLLGFCLVFFPPVF